MMKKSLWRSYASAWLWIDIFKLGFSAIISAPVLLIALYATFAPMPPQMNSLSPMQGTIERAQLYPCIAEERDPFWAQRKCVNGVAVIFRDNSGLVQTAVFRAPGDPVFDATRFPRGATVDLLVPTEDMNKAATQWARAVAINGAVVKPFKDTRMQERLLWFVAALACGLVVAGFVGRLQIDAEERAAAKAKTAETKRAPA